MSGNVGDCAGEIRCAVERALRTELPGLVSLLYRAQLEARVTDAEVAVLDALIRERQRVAQDRRELTRAGDAAPVSAAATVRRWGSRPRSDASMERRRRWAASGRLPPQVAAKFTLAEQAVLAVIAAEVVKRGACRMPHDRTAAIAGVSRSTVRATLRLARDLGLVTVEEQRLTPWRSLPSVVRIVSPEWSAWNRLVRRAPGDRGLCVISASSTPTVVLDTKRQRPAETWKRASDRRMAGPSSPERPTSRPT